MQTDSKLAIQTTTCECQTECTESAMWQNAIVSTAQLDQIQMYGKNMHLGRRALSAGASTNVKNVSFGFFENPVEAHSCTSPSKRFSAHD